MSSTARDDILGRISAANKKVAEHYDASLQTAQAAWTGLPRMYRQAASLCRNDILSLFIERLRDYDAQVQRSCQADVVSNIARVLAERGNPKMLIASGFSYPPPVNSTLDQDFSKLDLDGFHGVLTEATLGIAETGTLVLQNVPGQGRRAATLVPDFHLCILHSRDVVETVPEAIRRLAPTTTLPTTFISGPSATADIEMTRIKGVHGPRFLDVILVDE